MDPFVARFFRFLASPAVSAVILIAGIVLWGLLIRGAMKENGRRSTDSWWRQNLTTFWLWRAKVIAFIVVGLAMIAAWIVIVMFHSPVRIAMPLFWVAFTGAAIGGIAAGLLNGRHLPNETSGAV